MSKTTVEECALCGEKVGEDPYRAVGKERVAYVCEGCAPVGWEMDRHNRRLRRALLDAVEPVLLPVIEWMNRTLKRLRAALKAVRD